MQVTGGDLTQTVVVFGSQDLLDVLFIKPKIGVIGNDAHVHKVVGVPVIDELALFDASVFPRCTHLPEITVWSRRVPPTWNFKCALKNSHCLGFYKKLFI